MSRAADVFVHDFTVSGGLLHNVAFKTLTFTEKEKKFYQQQTNFLCDMTAF